ncbi:Ig-like domain-containing protein, partial [Neobacillus drentensis]
MGSQWSFSTVRTDTTKPYVVSQSPSNGSTNVAISTSMLVQFSENVQLNTSTINIRTVNSTSGSITGRVTLNSDRRTVTITPTSNLIANTSYYIEIPSDFVRDLSGNPNDAKTGTGFWSFTTTVLDKTAPVLQSTKMYN